MNKKPFLNLTKMLVMFAIIPLIVASLILGIVSIILSTDKLEENIEEELRVATRSLREYYEYDIINDNDLVDGFCEYNTDYIDRMATTGISFTLFRDDVRFMTTIKDGSGKRIEGTKANADIWNTVKNGNDYFGKNVKINGEDYYVYYMPLGTKGDVRGMAFSGKPNTVVSDTKRALILTVLLVGLATIAVFAVITVILSRAVATPIKNIANNIRKLSNGEPVSIHANSKIQETVVLIDSAQKLSSVLSSSMATIRSSADELKASMDSTAGLAKQSADGTDLIAKSMDNLAQATETMAESVQEINSNVISMGDMIENITTNAAHLNTSSSKMLSANREASGCIDNMSASSKKSVAAIETISQKITETNNSISKIEEMINFITEIADQTNLLALNASIEAARAGESGRGFGVVAEEIKHLAEQSNNSAMRITEIVSEISALSEDCVEQSKEVEKIIVEEQKLLEITHDKFQLLNNEINSSVKEINSVTAITDELSSIKSVITNAVSDLSAISEETAATNEEVTSSITSISRNVSQVSDDSDHANQLSDALKEAISYFKM